MRRVHCWVDEGDMLVLLIAVLKGRMPRASACGLADGVEERAREGLVAALLGNQQQAGQVGRDGGAAEEGEDGEGDAHDRDVDRQVVGEAGAHAGQHAAVVGAAERRSPGGGGSSPLVGSGLLVGWGLRLGAVFVCVHGLSLGPDDAAGYRDQPWPDPDPRPPDPEALGGEVGEGPDTAGGCFRVMMVACRNRANRLGRRSGSRTGRGAAIPGGTGTAGRTSRSFKTAQNRPFTTAW